MTINYPTQLIPKHIRKGSHRMIPDRITHTNVIDKRGEIFNKHRRVVNACDHMLERDIPRILREFLVNVA